MKVSRRRTKNTKKILDEFESHPQNISAQSEETIEVKPKRSKKSAVALDESNGGAIVYDIDHPTEPMK